MARLQLQGHSPLQVKPTLVVHLLAVVEEELIAVPPLVLLLHLPHSLVLLIRVEVRLQEPQRLEAAVEPLQMLVSLSLQDLFPEVLGPSLRVPGMGASLLGWH